MRDMRREMAAAAKEMARVRPDPFFNNGGNEETRNGSLNCS
jgi:hypothetical protein